MGEAFVLEELLQRGGLTPKIILVEVNSGIPPPLQFALHDSPQFRNHSRMVELVASDGQAMHRFEVNKPIAGVSLSYLVRHLAPAYFLLELGSPDAIFVRADLMKKLQREALDEFQAYERSWADLHGFSRQQVRHWYFNLDEIQMLGDVNDYLVSWMRRHLGV